MNKNAALWIPVGVAGILVIASSIVQGVWTNRFGARSDSEIVKEFADRLELVPKVIGKWEAVDHPMNAQEQEVAGIVGYVSREYRNIDTNQSVTVMLVCGNFRNIAKHEPTQCYVAAGFTQEKETEGYSKKTSDTTTANFNTTVFKREEQKELQRMRIFWSWNYNGEWVAPSYARWSLRGLPALYKLYVISNVRPGEDIEQSDALKFIEEFIPVVDQQLFPAPSAKTEPAKGSESPAAAEQPAANDAKDENAPPSA